MISKAKASELLKAYSAIKRARGWTDKRTCASLDIGPAKLRLLEYIAEHDGVSQTELARATDTDKALAGRSVQEFVENGWVRRARSHKDSRAYVLSLSPSGCKLVKQFVIVRDKILDRVTLALNARDVQDFTRVVSKLLDTMKEPSGP
jgi:DNA-binding MarR family transcriptional regulator